MAKGALRVAIVSVAIAVTVVGAGASDSRVPGAFGQKSIETYAQVRQLVTAATRIMSLPSNLVPPLDEAAMDQGTVLAQDVYGLVGSKRLSCNPLENQVVVPVQACTWGDPKGRVTVVLAGDSHAAQWIAAFDAIGKRLDWRIILFTKSACAVPDITFYDYTSRGTYYACDKWHRYVAAEINRIRPALVVFTSNVVYPMNGRDDHITAATWTAGLAKTLKAIRVPKVVKVVLGDEPRLGDPYPGEDGPDCLAAHERNIQFCSTPTAVATRAGLYAADEAGARAGGATYIGVTSWFCSQVCTAVVRNIDVYSDSGHITNAYAEFLSGPLQHELEGLLRRG